MTRNIEARAIAAVTASLLCGTLAYASAPQEPSGDAAAPEVGEEQVVAYCGGCHFKNVENACISSWNASNIDFAMVESMVPVLDDETIQGVVDYFAAIEPAE